MYCKNCGCKISTGDKKCPNCGTPVTEIEYCGGFWGLTEKSEKISGGKTSAKDKKYEELLIKVKNEEKAKKKYELLIKIVSGIAVILMIFGLAQTLRLSQSNKRNENYGDDVFKTKYERLRRRSKALITDYEELNDRFEDLKDQNKQTKKELIKVREQSEQESSTKEETPMEDEESTEKGTSSDMEKNEISDEDDHKDNTQETDAGIPERPED